MAHQKLKTPGAGIALFPGPKYKMKRGVLRLDDLEKLAQRKAVELGPDHPEVKMLRKEIADRHGKA